MNKTMLLATLGVLPFAARPVDRAYLPLPNCDHGTGGLKPLTPCPGWALLQGEVVDGREGQATGGREAVHRS